MSDREASRVEPIGNLFASIPLPRGRAITTILFAGFSFLAFAGVISFAAGSPDTQGRSLSTYWTVFFAAHFLLFGGATLFGWFPRLNLIQLKLVWILVLLAAAFVLYRSGMQLPEGAIESAWRWTLRGFLMPAGLVVLRAATWGTIEWSEAQERADDLPAG